MADDRGRVATAEVQRLLLASVPNVPGTDVAVSYWPYSDVGGDFYDVCMLEEQCIGITVGDVSGKGYEAALLMVYALAEIRTRLLEHQRLPYLMSRLDESLRKYSSDSKYAEMLVGTYSVPARRFSYIQAGGISPAVFQAQAGRLAITQSAGSRVPGMSLADPTRLPFVEHSVDLEKGDILLLFTDGLADREDEEGRPILTTDDFGARVSPRLKSWCEEWKSLGAAEIVAECGRWLAGLPSERFDDETLLVLKAI